VHERLLCLDLPLTDLSYPDLSTLFPAAARMQRAIRDLHGFRSGEDERPWLIHGDAPYAFVQVEGDGVHEIPSDRYTRASSSPDTSASRRVGERVLRLEQRLGYVHKGIERRFESMSLAEGARLAGRVSGDSTVAYAWAYAMALESAASATAPRRACGCGALLLERERIANHLGDLGISATTAGSRSGWRSSRD
jgi:hypothetical protein